ncbi:MAG: hypothetical protein J0H15_06000 [Xanthomonadales bacterium]|nr:hypothetical protein [Xanthomonadales bacterium]
MATSRLVGCLEQHSGIANPVGAASAAMSFVPLARRYVHFVACPAALPIMQELRVHGALARRTLKVNR